MATLLAMPELWGALSLCALVAYAFYGGRSVRRRQQRLARVTKRGKGLALAQQAASLRRVDPHRQTMLGQKTQGWSSVERLRARIELAGLAMTPQRLLAYALMLAGGVFFVAVVVLGASLLLGLLVGMLVGLGGPHLYIRRRLRARQRAFLKLFPEAIELMVRGLRAGLPIAESFVVVAREMPDPLAAAFARISQQTGLGVPMEQALADAAQRLDITEFNFFVTSIIMQRETGGNLGEILSNLADMLRQRQMMKLKIGALSSEARASAYIVGALPFFVWGMLTVLSPVYLQPLYHDFRGNLALGGAMLMMFIGAFIMKRMTQLDL